MDVHKAIVSVVIAHGEVRHWGTIPHRLDHFRKPVEKLAADGSRLNFHYEAGPCGYGLHRQLVEAGAVQFFHDPLVVGTADIQELSKTHEIVSRSKPGSGTAS